MSKPNILLIISDQHRGDCLGAAGHPAVLTPNLDDVARQGALFTRAYATCPSCIAARRSILTGQFPATHGMVGYQDAVEFHPQHTLPGELSKAGYQTFLVGRGMHQYPPRKCYGFDHMALLDDGSDAGKGLFDQDGHGLNWNGWTARPWHLGERQHPTVRTVDEAIRFLKYLRDPSRPFFLTVTFIAPHPPLCPPAFYMDRYLRMDLPRPAIGAWATAPTEGFNVDDDRVDLKGEALRSCQAGYYGLINQMDDQLSRLFKAMGTDPVTGRSVSGDTLTLYTSDHGELLGDHHLFRKAYPYEGSARIPFIIRLPSGMRGRNDKRCEDLVCLEDIMPTCLEAAGAPIPPSVEGRSLLPLMKGEASPGREWLHGEHATCYGVHHAHHYLVDRHQKYIWFSHSGWEQLFDLRQDPQETNDLASDPTQAKSLAIWRGRLIQDLDRRPEGFTKGGSLQAGRQHLALVPSLVE